jgi:hypothetical protein
MSAPTLTLGRDGFGATPTEEEFDSWVSLVCERIDDLTGLTVGVDARSSRALDQSDTITGCDYDDQRAIDEAKQALWQEWCAP